MPITRLGLANPSANTDTTIAEFSGQYLVSVTVANKAVTATPITRVTIWVVPANATIQAQYSYIAFNLQIGVGQAFETFRFGVLDGDTLFVRASTDDVSFSVSGILQDDALLAKNISETFTNKTIRGAENTLYLDKGTTAQRPSNIETGYTRYNTETDNLEVYTSEDLWEVVGTGEGGEGTPGADGADGADGEDGDSLNIRGSVFDSTYLPESTNDLTFTVTVESTSEGNKYYINGELYPDLYLAPGGTYVFDQSDASNDTHQIYLSETSNGHHELGGTVGEAEYTDGVTYTGTAGTDGQLTYIVPPTDKDNPDIPPETLYYVCVNHSGMAGDSEISIADNANNDAFIATDTGSLHIRDESTWTDVGRFVGPEGPQGPQGDVGPTGPTGDTGASLVLLGSVATVGDLPSASNTAGDAYVVDADGDVYVWDGSQWNNVGALEGPTGATGETGATGATGATGETGTGINWLGTWDSATSYAEDDAVEHQGSSYIAIVASPTVGTSPDGSADWDLIAQKGLDGSGGSIEVTATTDATTFVGLYEDATGTIGGKTNSGIIYDADTEKLTVTSIETESVQAPTSLTGTYSIVSPTTITLDATDEILNNAPIRLVNKTTAELSSLVASVGSVVYNTDDDLAYYYDGSSWNSLQGADGDAATISVGTVTTGAAGSSATVTNSGTTSAAVFDFSIPEGDAGATGPAGPAINAIATLDVANNLSSAYTFDSHYTGDNPEVYALGGATLAFDLTNVSSSHPFLIQEDSGSGFANISTGIIHIADDGTVTEGSGAQAQTSGTVYWEVPITSASTWRYICSVHSAMVGTLTIKSLTAI